MTNDKDAARDLAQDTFISAWEKIASFQHTGSFKNWIYRIATNKTLNFLEKEKRMVSSDNLESLQNSIESDSFTPDRRIEQSQMRQSIQEFVDTLPARQKLAFELRFYNELTFEEIAETTGNALGTVKTNYREAIGKLRQYAKSKGLRP
jgi:RNA polymerase sigma-70 factor (ECF subfamily)